MGTEGQRVDSIDGLRCFAVLSVMAFHYYYSFGNPDRSQPSLYRYEVISILQYGDFGVPLFFVISGFVIFGSLEESGRIGSFVLRRYFRLLPAMILCALISYFFTLAHGAKALNYFEERTPLNLLFSFTFVHPEIWNLMFNRDDIGFVDGAYWSLWTEVVFYLAAAIVFFSVRKVNFLTKWLIIVLALQGLRALSSPRITPFMSSQLGDLLESVYSAFLFFDISYWIYFTVGIFFYSLYKRRKIGLFEWAAALVLVVLQMYFIKELVVKALFVSVLAIFSVIVYRPAWVGFLGWRPLVTIGLVSYPLYLIHQNVGIMLTHDLSKMIADSNGLGLIPLFVSVVLVLLCYLIFVHYERPAIRYLRSVFLPGTRSPKF